MQASTLDLLFVGFRGFAVAAGAAIVLAIGAHGGRRAPEPTKLASNVVPITPKRTARYSEATLPVKLGDVDAFLLERVSHEEGGRVSWADAFLSYRAWCEASGCAAVDARAFGARLDALRDELGLKVRTKGQDVFFVDLKLAGSTIHLQLNDRVVFRLVIAAAPSVLDQAVFREFRADVLHVGDTE